MPLVRISLIEGKSAEYRRKAGDVVHQAMVEAINCPPQDRFQLITEHTKDNFLCAPEYLGISHTDDLIIIQITLNEGRTVELKKSLYKAIAEGLHRSVGVKPQDVFVSLVEVKKENWSFGNGVAQYAA
jgi:phenylpyruvate tautomerase PptA (4-oxalocrotonate tautomerase family)